MTMNAVKTLKVSPPAVGQLIRVFPSNGAGVFDEGEVVAVLPDGTCRVRLEDGSERAIEADHVWHEITIEEWRSRRDPSRRE